MRGCSHMLFGDAGGSRREAAEFNVAAPAPDEPLGSETVTLELPHVELPTVEVPRIEAAQVRPSRRSDATGAFRPPVLERPIVILSAPRAGSTLLFETLAQAAGVYTIGGESHQLIESIAALRPGRGVVSSNRLTRSDATTAIVTELRQRFAGRLRDRDGQPPASGAQRAAAGEDAEERAARAVPARGVSRRAVHLPAPRAARESLQHDGGLAREGLGHLPAAARLARALVAAAAARLRAPAGPAARGDRGIPVARRERDDPRRPRGPAARALDEPSRYEEFVRDPRAEIAKLLEFAGLAMDPRLEEYLSKPLPLSGTRRRSPTRTSGSRTRRRSSG